MLGYGNQGIFNVGIDNKTTRGLERSSSILQNPAKGKLFPFTHFRKMIVVSTVRRFAGMNVCEL
jgi:hypothetical protein